MVSRDLITPADSQWLRVGASVFVHGLPSAEAANQLGRASERISSWDAVHSLMRMHSCGAILYDVLRDEAVRAACDPPPAMMDWLRQVYTSSFSRSMLEPKVIKRCTEALSRAGVSTLVIKGLVVGSWLYPDPALREHTDIDLLVPESDAALAHSTLADLDYEQASGPFDRQTPFSGPPLHPRESLGTVAYRHREGGIPVDLSYDPLRVFWLPSEREQPFFQRWWGRRQTLLCGGLPIETLGPEDQFIQLARHLQFHDYSRITWFVDILLLLREHGGRLDWELIGREADAFGIGPALFRTLELGERVYAMHPPEAAWKALRPSALSRSLYRQVWPESRAVPRDRRIQLGNPLSPRMIGVKGVRQGLGLVILLADRHRLQTLSYLARRLFPPRRWLAATDGSLQDRSYLRMISAHHDLKTRLRHPLRGDPRKG